MARLYSDLLSGGGERYYFNLESAPGGLGASVGLVTVVGRAATIFQQTEVFRTPATAALTLTGGLAKAQTIMLPAQAALAYGGQIPGLAKFVTITNTVNPDYGTPQDTLPSVQTIMLVTPAQAALTLVYQQPNVTQGGNIGFISPGVGLMVLNGLGPNFQFDAGIGLISLVGLAPTLLRELVITPDTGYMSMAGFVPTTTVPFVWIDDGRAATPTWIDVPAA